MAERRILRGARILPMDGRRQPKRGDLLIDGGQLRAIGGVVGTAGALITETTHVVMPGLVQAHLHLDQALLDRGFVPDPDPWRFQLGQLGGLERSANEPLIEGLACAALSRGLLAGATTFGEAGRAAGRFAVIPAVIATGARVVAAVDARGGDPARALEQFEAKTARPEVAGRVRAALWLGDVERVGRSELRRAAKLSQDRGLPLVAHLAALPGDHGGLALLESAGALARNLILCHARTKDLARSAKTLAEAGVTLVLTPGADILLGAPPPPLETLLAAGVNLALGSDTGATRLGFDLFCELRILLRWLRGRWPNPASTALEIATRMGARALGLSTGAVEVGQEADLIAIDVDPVEGEDHEALARRIIELGGPDRVRTIWVGGEVAASDGRLVGAVQPDATAEEKLRGELRQTVASRGGAAARLRCFLARHGAGARAWASSTPS